MPVPVPRVSAVEIHEHASGLALRWSEATLRLEVCAPRIIRVAYAPEESFFDRRSLAVLPRGGRRAAWRTDRSIPGSVSLRTDELEARVDLTSGAVSFFDTAGQLILTERSSGRSLTPREEQGERALAARQQWEGHPDEALYGLGQHQFGHMNLKGHDVDLWQRNSVIAVPMFVSSRGYGILWDQNSRTRFGDLRELELIPAAQLLDRDGQAGALTGTYFADNAFGRAVATRRDAAINFAIPGTVKEPNREIHPDLPPSGAVSVRWEGFILPQVTGDHTLQPFYSSGLKVWIDDQLIIDHWRQGWLTWYDQARVRLTAGQRHRVRVEWVVDQGWPTLKLLWKTPTSDDSISLWSGMTDGIDYYFIHGPTLDRVVAGYRELTGPAPMMPVWAFGLWQSRERYRTAQQSLDVLVRYRALGVPIDNIVQDWQYWRPDDWGSHVFDPERFPDPDGWIREIHERYRARVMLSTWAKFYTSTDNFAAMQARGFMLEPNLREGTKDFLGHPFSFYDAFNPAARDLYWQQMKPTLFRRGVDAWWMDASEPEMRDAPMYEDVRDAMGTTAQGAASRVMLAYPLLHNEGFYQHHRAAAPDQRVFILTRSGFAGLQRTAAACWSGDITSTWSALRQQIPAGLSLGLSGLPYWTTDSGGFSVPPRWAAHDAENRSTMTPEDAAEWAELNTRWLQYATFCPLMRIHGQFPLREIWEFGGENSPAFATMVEFDLLRYRMLPYIYSVAGAITHEGGTLMRALVMDFPDDAPAREIGDQFMFGPSLLITPVTTYQARTQSVYLPTTPGGWYDFWTGETLAGGKRITAPAPFERIPVHVRAGAIVPFGPAKQYTTEKPADPLTVLVYAGADGAFTLYEDDGLSYGYERGEAARIAFRWDDQARTLTIGAREGSFRGMLETRTMNIVLVARARHAGATGSTRTERTVTYKGVALTVAFKQ